MAYTLTYALITIAWSHQNIGTLIFQNSNLLEMAETPNLNFENIKNKNI